MTILTDEGVEQVRMDLLQNLPGILNQMTMRYHPPLKIESFGWTDVPLEWTYSLNQKPPLNSKGKIKVGIERLDPDEESKISLVLYFKDDMAGLALLVEKQKILVMMPIEKLLDYYLVDNMFYGERSTNALVLADIGVYLEEAGR